MSQEKRFYPKPYQRPRVSGDSFFNGNLANKMRLVLKDKTYQDMCLEN